MASRTLITLGYILAFWGVLPGGLAALAAWGQRLLGARLHLPWLHGVGIALAGISGILLAVAIFQYAHASGSLPVSAFPSPKLIRTGVFGVWRHPIYFFSVLFFSGLGVALWPAGFIVASLPLLVIGTILYARIEEAGLEKRFGRAYERHRRQTSIVVPRLVRTVRPLSVALCRAFFRFEVLGRENGKADPPFFVIAAHRNYLDPVFVSLALNVPVHFVTTSEKFRTPLSRLFFTKLLAIPKKRYKPVLGEALGLRRLLIEGCAVGIFPEAERSWTGAMLAFKPSVVKLFLKYPAIPIVPIRLEGAYGSWPRWAPLPRRGKVTASVGKPVFVADGETVADLEMRLARLIEPRRAPAPPLRPMAAKGIETLIYRCPECLSFDAIRSGPGGAFWCARCPAKFEMLPDLSVRKVGRNDAIPLELLSRRIFAGPAGSASPQTSFVGFSAEGTVLAVEKRGRLKAEGIGRLDLSAGELAFTSGDALLRFDLGTVQAVLIEGSRLLQIYGGRPAVLSQFAFDGQSALKWQHLIAEAVRSRQGSYPVTA